MAVITFCSNQIRETGQTMSLAAIATHMAIEHNYKILIIPTSFNDVGLENCFWKYEDIRKNGAIENNSKNAGIESGFEGLIKAIASNRTGGETVRSYSRTVLKDRLDILLSPATKLYQEYVKVTPFYSNIISMANQYYDIIFVDLTKKVPKQDMASILQMSDIVVMTLAQKLKALDDFVALRDANDFYKRKNVMISIGRYDRFSKYNDKNVTRYLKEKKQISVIPYNTLFFEACSEGTIIDFFLKIRNVNDETDRNSSFIEKVKDASDSIIYKLQELQMKI